MSATSRFLDLRDRLELHQAGLTRTLACLAVAGCAAVALYYAVYSLHLGLTLTRGMPFKDQWTFVYGDYFSYLDGNYPSRRLFSQNNEHRLLTTRLVLFADAILFQMRGFFP